MAGISIIIVTWNGLHHLKTFLPSVVDAAHKNTEIIIADNASEDETGAWVSKTYPQVKLLSLDNNYGYCGGNNRAARHAEHEILLFLNNDVKVTPGWLNETGRLFDAHPDIGAVQPKLLDYTRQEYFEYAGAAGGLIDSFGYPYCRGRLFDTVEKDSGQFEEEADIFWASGAALAVRKNVFEELEGFDEDFEFHMEEIDLCWRIQRRGYRVVYTPGSIVYHLGGGSLAAGSPRKVYYNFRNNLFMLLKNWPAGWLFRKLPVRGLLDWAAALRALVSGAPAETAAIFKAHGSFMAALPRFIKKRRKCTLPRPNKLTGMFPVLLIWQYFVRGKHRYHDISAHEHPEKP